eukprot:10156736-Alexandrium_andersonii.AAC.1
MGESQDFGGQSSAPQEALALAALPETRDHDTRVQEPLPLPAPVDQPAPVVASPAVPQPVAPELRRPILRRTKGPTDVAVAVARGRSLVVKL